MRDEIGSPGGGRAREVPAARVADDGHPPPLGLDQAGDPVLHALERARGATGVEEHAARDGPVARAAQPERQVRERPVAAREAGHEDDRAAVAARLPAAEVHRVGEQAHELGLPAHLGDRSSPPDGRHAGILWGRSTTLGAVNAKVDEAIGALGALLGDRLSTSDSVRDLHGRDESTFPPALPDAVAFPRSTEEVAAVVGTCAEHGVPVVAFGTGSSVEGQILAVEGGVALDTSLMDAILRVSIEDLDATVQPGVTRTALEKRIGGDGAFFSVDPGADASLGGMAATGASGTNTVRYGTMRENVLALEVVLADGRIIRTGTRARKSSAGYDLTHLFIGSEGTLGIITELTLRLRPIPEATPPPCAPSRPPRTRSARRSRSSSRACRSPAASCSTPR